MAIHYSVSDLHSHCLCSSYVTDHRPFPLCLLGFIIIPRLFYPRNPRHFSERKTRRFLNQNAVAVVDLMLDDLSRPALEGFQAGLQLQILVFYFDFAIPLCFSRTAQ